MRHQVSFFSRICFLVIGVLIAFEPARADVVWNLVETGRYAIQIQEVNGKPVAFLKNSMGTWRTTNPRLIKSLSQGLSIRVDGKIIPITVSEGQPPAVKGTAGSAREIQISLYQKELARLEQRDGKVVMRLEKNLTSFDIRSFATDQSYPSRFEPVKRAAKLPGNKINTDIHTHLAGSLEFDSLMKMAYSNNVSYPVDLLDKLKIKYPQETVQNGRIPFQSLVDSKEYKASHGRALLADAMTIDSSQIRTFLDMENRYLYRGPITKNQALFKEMLWEVAKTSAKSGVKYTEQSISNILDPEWLKIAHAELPKIEKELGVKMRFVAGLWRHSDAEWNLDEITRLKRMTRSSPYIVGVDFMGHETNSTKSLESQIKATVELRKEFGETFQVRVHAGENPLNPGNVREAAELGASRVGHGLYIEKDAAALKLDPYTQKIDSNVLDKLRRAGTIIELNPTSNQALNNLSGGNDVLLNQFRQFKAAGVSVVLGSDGIGMYDADTAEVRRMLTALGFTKDDFAYIKNSERAYVSKVESTFKMRQAVISASNAQIPSRDEVKAFVVNEGAHYSDELAQSRANERKGRLENFESDFKEKGIKPFDGGEFKGMKALDVSGGSQSQFATLEKEGRMADLKADDIRATFRKMLTKLDPDKVFFITGGTQFGVEKMLHEEIAKYNATLPGGKKTFRIVGVLPEAASAADVFGPKSAGISHYKLSGKGWSDFGMHKLDLLNDFGGAKVAIAGKMFVADEFRYVTNSRLPIKTLYMDGPVGAGSNLASLDFHGS